MVFQSSDQVACFICQTIWESYGYPYEMVDEPTWDEMCDSLLKLYVPGMLRENLEKFVISFVYQQSLRDGWDDLLLNHLASFTKGDV